MSSHIHLNLTYLIEVDESEELCMKEDENSSVKWVPIEEVDKVSTEEWTKKSIYIAEKYIDIVQQNQYNKNRKNKIINKRGKENEKSKKK